MKAHARDLPVAARTAWRRRRDPRWRELAVVTILLAASLAAFFHLVEDYLTGDPIVRWDVELARWLHEHSSSMLVSLFKVVTLAGNAAVLAVICVLALAVLVRRGAFDDAALLVVVAVGIELLNALLKLAFHRPRPELAFIHLDTYSFPSGHAAGSAAIYGVLAYFALRHVHGLLRALVVAAAVVLVALIGFSRLYLGAHYLSDVLAGFSLGAAWLFTWILVSLLFGDRSILPLLPARLRRAAERRVGFRSGDGARLRPPPTADGSYDTEEPTCPRFSRWRSAARSEPAPASASTR
jgi:membrane-associated phospholipid phosphatase